MNKTIASLATSAFPVFTAKWIMTILLLISALGCKKNVGGNGGGGGGGGGESELLIKETLTGMNSVNNVVESATTLISYDANNNFTQTQLTDTSYSLDITITTNEITAFTYGNSLISGLTEAITTETSVMAQPPYGTNDSTYITFHANGSQVDYFVSLNKITTTGVPNPTTTITMDSALVTYDANGYVSTYTVFVENNVPGPYVPFYTQTFTYNGNNLSGYVLTNQLVPGGDVTTATYTYNNHNSASPFYNIIPGIFIKSDNDVSGLTEAQTGVNAGNTAYTYNTTYNSSNQPSVSSVAISMNPSNASFPVSETINYYYQ